MDIKENNRIKRKSDEKVRTKSQKIGQKATRSDKKENRTKGNGQKAKVSGKNQNYRTKNKIGHKPNNGQKALYQVYLTGLK